MEKIDPPHYIHIYPFRFVQQYKHTYRTFTKGRWVGKELLTTLIKQFKAYEPQYYESSVQNGRIIVNGQKVDPKYILKNGDQIIHYAIRREPPVFDLPIRIISQSEDLLVVSKPPSIVIHTGGGQHFNTVESILEYEHGFTDLHILHRLDKNTSGLLLIARKKGIVKLFHEQSEKAVMKKMYFARVSGDFPWAEKDLTASIQCISHKDGVYKVKEQLKDNQEQAKELQGKEEKQGEIKYSKTHFKKLWYDKKTDSSLLECYPITGRTHQIRVHLQHLKYPILNDTNYDGRFVGNGIIKFIKNQWTDNQEQKPYKKIKLNQQYKVEDWDFKARAWEIMLHSYKYRFGDKQYVSELPYWFEKQGIPVWAQ